MRKNAMYTIKNLLDLLEKWLPWRSKAEMLYFVVMISTK